MTKLDKPLRREVQIGDQLYTLTIAPEGLKLVEKGKRKGLELAWSALVGGDAALAAALLHEVRPRVQVSRPYASQPRRTFAAAIEVPALKLGSNVRHPTFGTGVVTDYEGSGAHARVQVNFDEAGSKWLVLAYANLQPA